ncbi:MAG: hypothetical protein AAGA62_10820, partial [Bacteroidota bacterium]
KDQGIDRLFLSDVYRRNFSQDVAEKPPGKRKKPHYSVNEVTVAKDFDERYYRMPGNYLVIPFGEIRNLNIIYTRLEEVPPESSTIGG